MNLQLLLFDSVEVVLNVHFLLLDSLVEGDGDGRYGVIANWSW